MPNRKEIILTCIPVLIIILVIGIIFVIDQQAKTSGPSMILGEAKVTKIEILIMESFPVQVNVIVHGEFPDSCTEIDTIITRLEGDTFFITVTTSRPYDKCALVITPFEEVIPLEVAGLKAGIYTVNVNGVMGTFELQVDNV